MTDGPAVSMWLGKYSKYVWILRDRGEILATVCVSVFKSFAQREQQRYINVDKKMISKHISLIRMKFV